MSKPTGLLHQAIDLEAQAAEAFEAGDAVRGEQLLAEAEEVRQRFRRSVRRSTANEARSSYDLGSMTDRDAAAQSLQELDAVASPKTVSAYAGARFDKKVASSSFSSIRRDDRRAWESTTASRTAYVVPALEGRFFTPARGMVALSTWELWRRVLGPRSHRVELLRAALQVIERTKWLEAGPDEEAASRMRKVAAALVSSVPGADNYPLDLDVAAEATEHELAELAHDDRAWREDAAKRAKQQGLDDDELLWGTEGLRAVKEG